METLNTIVLRKSGNSYFGAIANKFLYCEKEWYLPLMSMGNKKTYFIYELWEGKPLLSMQTYNKLEAENFMKGTEADPVLVFNEVEICDTNNLDNVLGDVLTNGNPDTPYIILCTEIDHYDAFMLSRPELTLPKGKLTHIVYKDEIFHNISIKF